MPDKTKTIHIIVNPAAGQDEPVLARLNAAFHDSPLKWTVDVTHGYGDGARLAREAVEAGADLIGVYGGDGTIGDVLNGLYPSDTPLVILPGGTGNGATRVLGISSDLAQAAQTIADGDYDLVKTDVGRINDDRLFLLRVDIGRLVDVVDDLERGDKDRFGVLSYYHAVLETYITSDDTTFRFKLDGGDEQERDGAALILFNMRKRYEGIRENIQKGALEFFLLRTGWAELAKGVATYATDRLDTDNIYEMFSAKKVTIETPEPFTVFADGEACGHTPVEIHVIPQAVTLAVPRSH